MNKKLILAGMGAVALFSSALAQKSISIKGSDTLLILNQRWAEVYGKKTGNGVDVTGGGSSIGINAFINGVTDICAASRPMKRSEIDKAQGRGAVANEIPVALDGLAFVVNANNSIDSLTMDDLRRIYIGQIKNWKQLGGPDEQITVYSRDSNSGTYGFVQTNVLRNQNWGMGVQFLPSTSEEVREVSRTAGGIAYGGVAYFKNKPGVKILAISKTKGSPALMPTEANVRAKKYPVWRYLYYYTNGKPTGAAAKFINWVLSPEGQDIVEQVGYYSLKS